MIEVGVTLGGLPLFLGGGGAALDDPATGTVGEASGLFLLPFGRPRPRFGVVWVSWGAASKSYESW